MKTNTLSLLALCCLVLIACGKQDTALTPASISAAESAKLLPADVELADIYQRSCQSCHVVAGSGAPLTGDVAAWQPRMDQGMETVLQHIIEGYGGMPPLGMCFECGEQQFIKLTQFMASGKN